MRRPKNMHSDSKIVMNDQHDKTNSLPIMKTKQVNSTSESDLGTISPPPKKEEYSKITLRSSRYDKLWERVYQ